MAGSEAEREWWRRFTPEQLRPLTRDARVLNLIGMGDDERLAECLRMGGNPNCRSKKGTPAIVRAVRGYVVESKVVRVLLEAGADPAAKDADGLTVLDRARARLAKFEGKPRKPPRRSPSLTPFGDVRLHDFENEALERLHAEDPDIAEDFEAGYLAERRRIAERVFDTRGELERIVALLDPATPAP